MQNKSSSGRPKEQYILLKWTFIEIRGIRYNICFVAMAFYHSCIVDTIKIAVIKDIAIYRSHAAVFGGFVIMIEKVLFLLIGAETHHKINRTVALPPLVPDKICCESLVVKFNFSSQ